MKRPLYLFTNFESTTMKKLFALALLALSFAAQAEWTHLFTDTDGESTFFDMTTRLNTPLGGQVWVMVDHPDPEVTAGEMFYSSKILYAVSCKQKIVAPVHLVFYLGRFGGGKVVANVSNSAGRNSSPVIPGTLGSRIYEEFCVLPQPKEKPHARKERYL